MAHTTAPQKIALAIDVIEVLKTSIDRFTGNKIGLDMNAVLTDLQENLNATEAASGSQKTLHAESVSAGRDYATKRRDLYVETLFAIKCAQQVLGENDTLVEKLKGIAARYVNLKGRGERKNKKPAAGQPVVESTQTNPPANQGSSTPNP